MVVFLKNSLLKIVSTILAGCLLPFVAFERLMQTRHARPRLFFGATSIFVLPKLVEALRAQGYCAISGAVADVDFQVPPGFDRVVTLSASQNMLVRYFLGTLGAMRAFVWAMRRADIFHHYTDGGFLRRTPLQLWEIKLLQLANKKVVLFPYGSDAWCLDRIPDPTLRAALLADYPQLLQTSQTVSQRLDLVCSQADLVVGCLVHNMSLPKCDVHMMTCYGVETDKLLAAPLLETAAPMRIFHAPNHRNCKGTDYLLAAVENLKSEGFKIELDLVERVPRHIILDRMKQAHVVFDQLLCGYGMTALEGMALGRIVISGENWGPTLKPFISMAAYKECPIHWASPQTVVDVLRKINRERNSWPAWSRDSRTYVETYHSPRAMADAWTSIHPRLGYDFRSSI